jgi:hypothetical protein
LDDLELREAQLVFVDLECRWTHEKNRNPRLMRALEKAENRLLSLFTDEWRDRGGDRRMMALAYSHYRKTLLYHEKRN